MTVNARWSGTGVALTGGGRGVGDKQHRLYRGLLAVGILRLRCGVEIPAGRVRRAFTGRGRERGRARVVKDDAEASDYQRAGGGTGRKACMTGVVVQITPRTDNSSA